MNEEIQEKFALLQKHLHAARVAEKNDTKVACDEYTKAATALHFIYLNEKVPARKEKWKQQLSKIQSRIGVLLQGHIKTAEGVEKRNTKFACDEYIKAATTFHFMFKIEPFPERKEYYKKQLSGLLSRIEELKGQKDGGIKERPLEKNPPPSKPIRKVVPKIVPKKPIKPQPPRVDPQVEKNRIEKNRLLKLSIASETEAVILDESGNLDDSQKRYIKAIEPLLRASKLELDLNKKKEMDNRVRRLLKRAEELKELIDLRAKKKTEKKPIKRSSRKNMYPSDPSARLKLRNDLGREGIESQKKGKASLDNGKIELANKYYQDAIGYLQRAGEVDDNPLTKKQLIDRSRELAGYVSLKITPLLNRTKNDKKRDARWYQIKVSSAIELSKDAKDKLARGMMEDALGSYQQSHRLFKELVSETPVALIGEPKKFQLAARVKILEETMDKLLEKLGPEEEEFAPIPIEKNQNVVVENLPDPPKNQEDINSLRDALSGLSTPKNNINNNNRKGPGHPPGGSGSGRGGGQIEFQQPPPPAQSFNNNNNNVLPEPPKDQESIESLRNQLLGLNTPKNRPTLFDDDESTDEEEEKEEGGHFFNPPPKTNFKKFPPPTDFFKEPPKFSQERKNKPGPPPPPGGRKSNVNDGFEDQFTSPPPSFSRNRNIPPPKNVNIINKPPQHSKPPEPVNFLSNLQSNDNNIPPKKLEEDDFFSQLNSINIPSFETKSEFKPSPQKKIEKKDDNSDIKYDFMIGGSNETVEEEEEETENKYSFDGDYGPSHNIILLSKGAKDTPNLRIVENKPWENNNNIKPLKPALIDPKLVEKGKRELFGGTEIFDILGQGTYGTCYRASYSETEGDPKKTVCVKEIQVSEEDYKGDGVSENEDILDSLKIENEVQLVMSCSNDNNPFILKVHGYTLSENTVMSQKVQIIGVVREYLDGGSLFNLIEKWKREKMYFSEDEENEDTKKKKERERWILKWEIIKKVVGAVDYLHSKKDLCLGETLNPNNFLVSGEDKKETIVVKLGDFGLDLIKKLGRKRIDEVCTPTPTTKKDSKKRFIPPEFIMSNFDDDKPQKDRKTDIYSLGLLLFYIATETVPFDHLENDFEVMNAIKDGEKPRFTKGIPKVLMRLITFCIDEKKENRPSANVLLKVLEERFSEFLSCL